MSRQTEEFLSDFNDAFRAGKLPTADQMQEDTATEYLIYLDLLLMDGKYWTGEIDIGHRICPVRKH